MFQKYPLQELGFNMKQKYFNSPPIGKITHVCLCKIDKNFNGSLKMISLSPRMFI